MKRAWMVAAAAVLILGCGSRNVKESTDSGQADAALYGDIEVQTAPANEPGRQCYRESYSGKGRCITPKEWNAFWADRTKVCTAKGWTVVFKGVQGASCGGYNYESAALKCCEP